MKILEYAAKELLLKYGLPVKKGKIARTPEEAREICEELGGKCVIKAQVPVGGRGKAGGIKIANSPEEAFEKAKKILGMKIKGIEVKKVYVVEIAEFKKEIYAGIFLDRKSEKAVLMVSSEGGVEIEEVAKTNPDAIVKHYIDPRYGLLPYEAREVAFKLGIDNKLAVKVAGCLYKMYKAFEGLNAQLVEVNPLVVETDGNLLCLDAKIILDDNAIFKNPDLLNYRDMDYEDPYEIEAKEKGLSFVKLDGNIGCAVNGAGLAMATMDIIKKYGGEPANFLDVGGSSNPDKMKNAINIILSDKNVKSIYVNIFGGITRCDDIAKGLISAFKELDINVPVVVRLTGTNEELGRKMLKESGLPLHTAQTMREGAQLAIKLAGEAK